MAAQYTEAIVSYCESLRTFPFRGTQRDDVRPGLRITNYKKRTVIAFDVDTEAVSIIGVFYGGQDYETALREDDTQNIETIGLARLPCLKMGKQKRIKPSGMTRFHIALANRSRQASKVCRSTSQESSCRPAA